MTPRKWVNLLVAGLFLFYTIQIILDFVWGTMCGHIGVDYCDYWSAGSIANTFGYSRIYDLQLIGQVERSIFPPTADPSLFITSPFAYLPIFAIPFQFLSLLPPAAGFGIWSLLNLAGLIAYEHFFAKSLNGSPPRARLLLMMLASLPVFFNVFYGQVDAWLMICVGEFIRQSIAGRGFRAGLWLGGLLLKPQLLLLLGVILLLQRAVRVLAGLAATSALVLGISLLLLGPDGFINMARVWLGFAAGLPSNETESMMNWRMLGVHLSNLLGPSGGWGIAGAGMLATLILAFYISGRSFQTRAPSFSIGMLGILAASTLLAWHSHVHLALVLLPPLTDLRQKNILPHRLMDIWVLAPALLFVLVLLPENLMKLNLLADDARHFVFFLRGAGEFAVNLLLLVWAFGRSRHQAPSL